MSIPVQTFDVGRNVKLHLISEKKMMEFEIHAAYRSWGHCWDPREELQRAISGVDRARVMELVNPEPDRPLAAHFRAACLRSALFLVIVDLSKNVLKHIQKTNWSDFPWHLLHISLGPTARHSSLQGHHPEAFGWCC